MLDDVAAYREAILRALLALKDETGAPRLDEATATRLLAQLSDQELQDGMLFNTPQEVAELIWEVG